MAGLEVNVYDGRTIKHKVKYGEIGESIFNQEIAMFVKNILNFSSSDSPTNEDDPYVIEEDKKEIFFGYVLQLCHVVKWVGHYIEFNPDVEVNRSKTKVVSIETVATTKTKEDYTEKVMVKPEEKPIEIPVIETLEGSIANIAYHRCGKLACGPYCKLDSKWSSNIGKKATIKSLEPNKGKDSKDLPYIATEIVIAE